MISHDPHLVAERLEASRQNLLDTSRRNRLINYRPSRASGAEIFGEDPFEIHRLIVTEGRPMTFSGKKDPPKPPDAKFKAAGQDPLYIDDKSDELALYELRAKAEQELAEYLGYEQLPVDQADLVLDTPEFVSKLKTRLLKTYRDARTIIEETGVNVLFLALGMLEWQETDNEKTARKSPLILIPVQLEPKADGTYRLRHDGSEIGGNLSLQAMMLQEFGIRIPSLPEAETLDVRAYFAQVQKAISTKPEWGVNTGSVVLGFFSYAKFLLYTDLQQDRWPEDRQPSEHGLLGPLLDSGFTDDLPGLPTDGPLDPLRPLVETHDVIGADSSQMVTIMEAATGRPMVVQGPPGTGKSQTITNLLADALARGKRVLFVAEKMAALDVVARNLERVGLRDACLELHSQKARKIEFYRELKRVQELARPGVASMKAELEMFESHRDELNAYADAVNLLLDGRGISPRYAMGMLVQLGPETPGLVRLDPEPMAAWDDDVFKTLLPLVRAMQAKVAQIGPPKENPFFGSRMILLLGMDVPGILSAIQAALKALRTSRASSAELSSQLKIDSPKRLEDVGAICRAAKRAVEAPRLEGVAVSTATWKDHEGRLRQAIAAGKRLTDLKKQFGAKLIPAAWSADVTLSRAAFVQHGPKWYRFLIGDFRRASKQLDSLSQSPGRPLEEKLELANAILEAQEQERVVESSQSLCEGMFGVQWQGEASDWDSLTALTDWVVGLHQAIGTGDIPGGILRFFDGGHTTAGLVQKAETALADAGKALEEIKSLLTRLQFGTIPPPLIETFDAADALLTRWIAGEEKLFELTDFNKVAVELESKGLGQVSALCSDWPEAGAHLAESFTRTWYETVLREAFASRPPLQRFDRQRHEEVVRTFRELDNEVLRYNRTKIRLQHYQGVPKNLIGGTAAWLQKQMGMKVRHAPIRKAMSQAGPVIQAIKPLFMMSPLSVAMYLPQDGPQFDLVVFDEASQVKPEDAFGALLRGAQAIVVGDSKQMPPTSFFERMTSGDEEVPEEDEERNVTRDMESILSLMDARLGAGSAGKKTLRWHYRSRHHSLIEPSNALFYKYDLFLIPNPEPPDDKLGLRLHQLTDTVYDRGNSRTNKLEAHLVAQAALRHIRETPAESLMIVAFSQAQQQAIQDELDLLIKGEPAFIAYAENHTTERLDVKNLENVQGDERDVVYISVGYGRDAQGYVSMSFGPLNQEGGERRLNVLITRARKRCEVFTNLRADDIKAEGSASAGLSAFKEFLQYAETGRMNVAQATGLEPMSPFEEAVIAKLQLHGYSVEPQVGCAGFFIDIGLRDPKKPERFLLGIECDGAQYHRSRTARERDKLRQAVLEDRGWRLHRIWSTDWFNQPDRELRRCLEAITLAQTGSSAVVAAAEAEPEDSPVEVVNQPEAAPSRQVAAYEMSSLSMPGEPFHELTGHELAELVREVVLVESPVHVDEVVRRIREAAGLARAGDRIRSAIEDGIRAAEGADFRRVGDFLFAREKPVVLRDRSSLPAHARKIELISDAELALALQQVVADSFEITPDEAAMLAPRLLGFDRVTAQMKGRLLELVRDMCDQGLFTHAERGIRTKV